MTPVSTVAVLRAGALGDVVLTLPALRALKARYPDRALRAVGYPEVWSLAEPLIHDITSIDSPIFAGLLSASPSPALQAWLEGVDLAVAWTARDPTAALCAGGVAEVIHFSPHPPPGLHAANWLLQSISAPVQTPAVPTLDLQPEEMARGHAILARLGLERPVILHPGAGAGWKRWPAARFARVGDNLRRVGHEVVLVEGPADAEVTEEVQAHAGVSFPVIRNLPVRSLGAVLAAARLYLGNDSGVTHLAAAAGAHVVALFGPTDPASWAPRGDVRLLRACARSSAAQGQIRVCEDPGCMEGIDIDDVLRAMHGL